MYRIEFIQYIDVYWPKTLLWSHVPADIYSIEF